MRGPKDVFMRRDAQDSLFMRILGNAVVFSFVNYWSYEPPRMEVQPCLRYHKLDENMSPKPAGVRSLRNHSLDLSAKPKSHR